MNGGKENKNGKILGMTLCKQGVCMSCSVFFGKKDCDSLNILKIIKLSYVTNDFSFL